MIIATTSSPTTGLDTLNPSDLVDLLLKFSRDQDTAEHELWLRLVNSVVWPVDADCGYFEMLSSSEKNSSRRGTTDHDSWCMIALMCATGINKGRD